METWSETVDRLFANSEDEIEAFQVWIMYDATPGEVRDAMKPVMNRWMDSERRDHARSRFDQGLRDEGR